MKLFTWFDVETIMLERQSDWPTAWKGISVYSDEVIVYYDAADYSEAENTAFFSEVFGASYREGLVYLEYGSEKLDIVYEENEEDRKNKVRCPLFKDACIGHGEEKSKKLPVPIIAFHSYKGGVGRTLSLISLTRELTYLYENRKKILVVDADMEAPGLTWMLSRKENPFPISYLDILSLLHTEGNNEELIARIVKDIRKSRFVIETRQLAVEQYFLPLYRDELQMMNIVSSPEKIIATQDNKYIVPEFLSQIGAVLQADLILVDLRAGITEFSAPFLFDARVQKYMVSSTSMQSIQGTRAILKRMGDKNAEAKRNVKVLLTMIPKVMEYETLEHIEDELAEHIEAGMDFDQSMSLREDYLIRIPFDDSFISLGNFQDICSILKGRNLSDIMREIGKGVFDEGEDLKFTPDQMQETLCKINRIASDEITAEANSSSRMLATASIREIARDHLEVIPKIVIMGAKGSGKTYVFKHMLERKTWGGFLTSVVSEPDITMDDAVVLPLLSTANGRYIDPLIKSCIGNINTVLKDITIDFEVVQNNYDQVKTILNSEQENVDWNQVWSGMMSNMLGENFENITFVDEYLQSIGKKIVFLVDGLEDLYTELREFRQAEWNAAVRSLCRDITKMLGNLKYGNLGIVLFIRKDMVEDAISMNFEQFQSQYYRYELKWSPTEALRLALWIAAQANNIFNQGIDILNASREAIESKLEFLWGKKLGKKNSREAYSSRWIIAALSDFNGQLQARDIVRFLQYSTDTFSEKNIPYPDRCIMPLAIRNAILPCSVKKYEEIKTEMKSIYLILKKFEDMEQPKRLPLSPEQISLTGEEINKLKGQGFITAVNDKYYLPEIIRFALGFQYEKGARPKVLSLLQG